MTNVNFPAPAQGPKSFWKRPEGVTGTVVLLGLLAAGGVALYKALPYLITLTSNLLYLSGMLLVLGAVIYMVLDPRMRNLIGYMYKSMMRWITGIFVTIDPIGILKNYVDDLKNNLAKMSEQIGVLRGQMNKMKTLISEGEKEIRTKLATANYAKNDGNPDNDNLIALNARAASRLQETNARYNELLQKMEIMHRVLKKMYENSEILMQDTADQVKLKEQERKAIRTAHGAMRSAMNVINGNADQRAIFDMSLEHIADDIANKVGEMEHFMDSTKNLMNSIDLQKGVFEAEGMKMLEEWEKKANVFTLAPKEQTLQLNANRPEKVAVEASNGQNQYDEMFKEAK